MKCVNKRIEGRTLQEYYEEEKNYISERIKKYNEEHKEQITEYQKKYHEEHKPQIAEYQKQNYEDNKEQRLEDAKNYRDKHREKYTCACGSILGKLNKSIHERSKKHLEFLNLTV